jgi:hypothetical protein
MPQGFNSRKPLIVPSLNLQETAKIVLAILPPSVWQPFSPEARSVRAGPTKCQAGKVERIPNEMNWISHRFAKFA